MSNDDLDMPTEKNMYKATPRYYPIYRCAPVLFTLHSAKEDDRKGPIIQSDVEAPVHFLKCFDANLLHNSSSIEKKAEILATTERSLSDVICLQNAELTRAYLEKKLLLSHNDFDKLKQREDPYSLIDNDTRDSVDQVMNSLDLQNAEVILTCEPGKNLRRLHFFYNLVTMATENKNLKVIEAFVRQVVNWNILDEEGSRLIEQEVFQKANKAVLRIFLQYRLDYHIEKFGKSAMAALLGNPNVKIGALKRKKTFNVNAQNQQCFNALHYAMKNKNFKRLKFLLDRGADPNTISLGLSPLALALWEPTVNPIVNAKCAELLLQFGASPFETKRGLNVGFYRCMYAKRALAGDHVPAMYAPTEYLTKLALAYACMYDVYGARYRKTFYRCGHHLDDLLYEVERDGDMLNFYRKCHHELQLLKEHEIRQDLTMFTIALETGKYLFRLIKNEDQIMITSLLQRYSEDKTIHPYYINAMREHMRQYRKLAALKNRAMFVIAESVNVLATCFIVLNEIASYLSYEELLMFQ